MKMTTSIKPARIDKLIILTKIITMTTNSIGTTNRYGKKITENSIFVASFDNIFITCAANLLPHP